MSSLNVSIKTISRNSANRYFSIKTTAACTMVPVLYTTVFFALFHLKDVIFFVGNRPDLFLRSMGIVVLGIVLPAAVLNVGVLYLYLRIKARRTVDMLGAGLAVHPNKIDDLAKTLTNFKTVPVIIAIFCAFSIFLLRSVKLGNISDTFNYSGIRFLVWITASEVFCAYFMGFIADRTFGSVRALMKVHTMQNKRLSSIRLRYIILTVTLSVSLFMSSSIMGESLVRNWEVFTTQQLAAGSGAMTYAEADENVRKLLSDDMTHDILSINVEPEEIRLPNAVTLDDVRAFYFTLDVVSLIVVIVVALILELTRAGALRDQVGATSQAIRSIIKGEASLRSRVNIINFDDFGYMTGYINLLLRYFEDMVSSVRNVSKDIIDASAGIETAAARTNTAVHELMTRVDSVTQDATQQDREVEQNNEYLNMLSQTIAIINQSLQDQAKLVSQTSSITEQFSSSAAAVGAMTRKAQDVSQELVSVADAGSEAVGAVMMAIGQINDAAKNMSNAAGVITRIASQTNLLSMNAAIEAAHAGEAGKGFAVVANEVRSLSENATHQSHNIKNEVNEMNSKIMQGLDVSTNTQAALQKIVNGIQNTKDIISQIAAAMDEQVVGAKDIVGSIAKLNEASSQMGRQTSSQSSQSEAMIQSMKQLLQISEAILGQAHKQTEQGREVSTLMKDILVSANMNLEKVNKLRDAVAAFNLD